MFFVKCTKDMLLLLFFQQPMMQGRPMGPQGQQGPQGMPRFPNQNQWNPRQNGPRPMPNGPGNGPPQRPMVKYFSFHCIEYCFDLIFIIIL